MSFFSGINFFIIFTFFSIIGIILGVNGCREYIKKYVLILFSLVFAFLIYSKITFIYLILFIFYEFFVIDIFLKLKSKKHIHLAYFVFLGLLPLIVSRILPFVSHAKWGFLGISYITFKVIQMLIEINDGIIKEVKFFEYFLFMIFFPTISSGPIDRSDRFLKDLKSKISKNEYLEKLGQGLEYILTGLFYKIVLSQLIFDKMDIVSKDRAVVHLILYMYLYGFYLFFDFAGYSLMAVGASKVFGIDTPMNFNKPFLAKDLKDFWNRWHISLSHWFRDFVFNRLVFKMFKNKTFKSQLTIAMSAYIVDMLLMGIWHGLSFSYLIYGLYHGIFLAITECIQKTKFYKKHKRERIFKYICIFITFNIVMFGFFIFSGKFTEVLKVVIRRLF